MNSTSQAPISQQKERDRGRDSHHSEIGADRVSRRCLQSTHKSKTTKSSTSRIAAATTLARRPAHIESGDRIGLCGRLPWLACCARQIRPTREACWLYDNGLVSMSQLPSRPARNARFIVARLSSKEIRSFRPPPRQGCVGEFFVAAVKEAPELHVTSSPVDTCSVRQCAYSQSQP